MMNYPKRHIFIFLLIVLAMVMLLTDMEPSYTETGTASYYAMSLEGNPTTSGEIYLHDSLTAAHRSLPLGTKLKVENLDNGKTVVVRVNDRGPYADNRILDLSRAAFKQLAPLSEGLIEVEITEID